MAENDLFFNLVEEKFVWQISYPPANDASQGNFFLPKMGVRTKCRISPFVLNVYHLQSEKCYMICVQVTFRRSRTTEEILPI